MIYGAVHGEPTPGEHTTALYSAADQQVGTLFSNQLRDDSFAIKRLEKSAAPPLRILANTR